MKYYSIKWFMALSLFATACQEAVEEEVPEDAAFEQNTQEEVSEEAEEQCASKDDFVPEGWKILDEKSGDLNKDGMDDVVLILQSTDPKKVQKDEYFEIDSNPRTLVILFATKNKGCYEKHTESKTFVPAHTESNMEDPYSDLEIVKGTLRLKYVQFANAGSWFTSQYDYVWRFQDGSFKLIGASSTEFHRGSGEANDVSINFSTGKYSLKSYNMFDETVKEEEVWKTLKKTPLRTFSTFSEPWSWKVNEDLWI